jgi:hypothetical protein
VSADDNAQKVISNYRNAQKQVTVGLRLVFDRIFLL